MSTLPPCPGDIDPAALPDPHEHNDDGSTSYGLMLQCPWKYRATRDTGLVKRRTFDDPLEIGSVIHYGHMLAWRSVQALQQGRPASWPNPIKATLAAVHHGVLPTLTADGWDRCSAALTVSLPDQDQDHAEVVAVEQQGALLLGDLPASGQDLSEDEEAGQEGGESLPQAWYRPTLDLVQRVTLPDGRSALMMIDHKTSAKHWGPTVKRLFELHMQFIGMAALAKYGGYLRCGACAGVGCSDCQDGWVPLAPERSIVAVNFIGSRPPHGATVQALTINKTAVAAFRATMLDTAKRRVQYAALEAAAREANPKDEDAARAVWPRAMSMFGPCSTPFHDGLCDKHKQCWGER